MNEPRQPLAVEFSSGEGRRKENPESSEEVERRTENSKVAARIFTDWTHTDSEREENKLLGPTLSKGQRGTKEANLRKFLGKKKEKGGGREGGTCKKREDQVVLTGRVTISPLGRAADQGGDIIAVKGEGTARLKSRHWEKGAKLLGLPKKQRKRKRSNSSLI